jgi:rSAM/selenodomain-associated transferase 1
MDRNLLIFIKAPASGFAKTRLVPPLVPAEAAALSQAMARDTLAVARQVAGTSIHLAYQPHPDWPTPDFLDLRGVKWFPQVGDDLGQRLEQAIRAVFAGGSRRVSVIGSDLPSLTPAILEQAFELLEESPLVFGPSEDGGYYLAGLRQPWLTLFQKMPWSEPTLLERTLAAASQLKLEHRLLPRLRDLDTADDLSLLRRDPAQLSVFFHDTIAFLREL